MDENIEEIIKISWKASPRDTDYYLSKYIVDVTSQLNRTIDTMNEYDELEHEFEAFYDNLLQKSEVLQKKINKLNRIVSSLRGS